MDDMATEFKNVTVTGFAWANPHALVFFDVKDDNGKVVNCFMKCEADRTGRLRGRRQIMLDDSDVHHHRHSKGAVGGVAAAAIGDPAVFVSVDAMHQGPQGGGPVIAIVDAGE